MGGGGVEEVWSKIQQPEKHRGPIPVYNPSIISSKFYQYQ
jgi:hypothetical protein